jgi:photosystem II stability/assembly factor-like uncharacterized protein
MPDASRLTALALLAACARPNAPAPMPNGRWVDQPSGTAASLRGVSAVSERVAWASGARNTVLRTTDGGATWAPRPVPGADSLDFRSLRAVDERVAYVASAGDGAAGHARIYRTSDGGATWTLVLADTTKGVFFDALGFWDADHGLALSDPVGGRFVVLATDDGGRTWRRADAMPPARDGEAAFAAGGAALAVAGPSSAWFVTGGTSGARVFHSADRGRTWTVVDAPVALRAASAGLFAVAFRDGRVGVAVGGDYTQPRAGGDQVLRSSDGGRSWTPAPASPATTGYWSGLAAVPGPRPALVAVGGGGTTVSLDDGTTWTRADTTELNAVSFASPTAGWAVGPRGRIVRWSP